jgi:hypothetical protein
LLALQKREKQIQEEEKRVRQEQKKALAIQQQTVIGLVFERFPSLLPLAKKQVRVMKQLEQYSQLILHLSLARDVEEAQKALLFLVDNPEQGEKEAHQS